MFQSTPPHGRRPLAITVPTRSMTVSIHASAREATLLGIRLATVRMVSIHASAREATTPLYLRCMAQPVSIPRLRTGGDPFCRVFCVECCVFQSTPPHGRRLGLGFAERVGQRVSIHASAREATQPFAFSFIVSRVSIHASAREATHRPGVRCGRDLCFNPRLRTGGDCDRRWPARLKVLRA